MNYNHKVFEEAEEEKNEFKYERKNGAKKEISID